MNCKDSSVVYLLSESISTNWNSNLSRKENLKKKMEIERERGKKKSSLTYMLFCYHKSRKVISFTWSLPDGNQLIIGGINRTKLYELLYFEKNIFQTNIT